MDHMTMLPFQVDISSVGSEVKWPTSPVLRDGVPKCYKCHFIL